jgi:hypothetical protein
LSTSPEDGIYPARSYYDTGYCFWDDVVKAYGYPTFVEIMQALYTKGRDINNYYVLDVFENIIGDIFSQEILDRYSITRSSTKVELCNKCGIF